MASFSQRMGITPLEKAIQLESIDQDLRHGLWNFLHVSYWISSEFYGQGDMLMQKLWFHFFKLPIDTCPSFVEYDYHGNKISSCGFSVCRKFMLSDASPWWKVYDFLEFVIKNSELSDEATEIAKSFLNNLLERENAGYRLLGMQIVPISDQNEIQAIETALTENNASVTSHFQSALTLLADRKSPDYRNSIKESISAVESLCDTLAGGTTSKFSDALTELGKMCSFHPALKRAFLQLYGYTSDSGGIRHALTEDSEHPSYADAKFMLVTCSAFCNFLQAKMSEEPQ